MLRDNAGIIGVDNEFVRDKEGPRDNDGILCKDGIRLVGVGFNVLMIFSIKLILIHVVMLEI